MWLKYLEYLRYLEKNKINKNPTNLFMVNTILQKRLVHLLLPFCAITFMAGFTSCSGLIVGMYGMKKPKPVNEATITRYAGKYNIPTADLYVMDTSFIPWLLAKDTSLYKWEIHNHYQPLQALYYNHKGELTSFQINCYTGGFPNLQWERDSIFDVFPPLKQTKVDSLVPLEKLLAFIEPIGTAKPIDASGFDYFIVVLWNRFMGRQSKRLIRIVQRNSLLAKDSNIRIVYVNTDNNFAHATIE
jgi:hypothetical protein